MSASLIWLPGAEGEHKRQEGLEALLVEIIDLADSDPDLFNNRLLEELIPGLAEFISLSATYEDGTISSTLMQRDVMGSISQLLSRLHDLPDLPMLLQEQVCPSSL